MAAVRSWHSTLSRRPDREPSRRTTPAFASCPKKSSRFSGKVLSIALILAGLFVGGRQIHHSERHAHMTKETAMIASAMIAIRTQGIGTIMVPTMTGWRDTYTTSVINLL